MRHRPAPLHPLLPAGRRSVLGAGQAGEEPAVRWGGRLADAGKGSRSPCDFQSSRPAVLEAAEGADGCVHSGSAHGHTALRSRRACIAVRQAPALLFMRPAGSWAA